MTIWAAIAALISGGGYGSYEIVKNHALEIGDSRYLKLITYEQQLEWELEDKIRDIQRKIKTGTATQDDIVDKAVYEERLKQLEAIK